MVLSDEDRGALERTIDNAIKSYVAIWLPYFRKEENKKHMQYQQAEDVVFGVVWGTVLATFLPSVKQRFENGMIPDEDLKEIHEVMYNRGNQIRQAIYGLG
jgi:hypothetical protein